ncbi:ATP-dependent DNA ligase LigD phosphoesterase module /ATP-dependent DNA ligase LigD polymerase module [Ancylobacter aquaticus]|uniref:DNA ligase (ATP) n=1 Tax=Ancylobacter aquaticus TaxID=100 RepID=A0A4R1IAH4_ANCAQ|nr:DNA ligase D [Ancylobacter aquaticus]TCK30995.1 ATP-dependent DNA ligase LigD phosphoesterase module /ATP-dependent DNA ligase LigD polymerase module [Ancylobacter aquaticus]
MALDAYRRKRDFTRTREPQGGEVEAPGHAYLIQKHAARRLHYDLRLEMDGVLKSWAVTRGPSLVTGEKRLAVHVEDHPLDYGSFEGTIPKGEYGGGTVLLWDRGSWEPVGDAAKGYKKGHLEFELHGEKLSGRWHLVRMAPRRGEKADNWLLMKVEDAAARPEGAPDILEEMPDSVKTGRTLDAIAKGEDPPVPPKSVKAKVAKPRAATKAKASGKAKASTPSGDAAPLPAFVEPALATLVAKAPGGKLWIHEIKYDGYRLQARLDLTAKGKSRVKLLTRSGLDWTPRFGPALAAALEALPAENALIDGELVVENGAGVSNFSLLQQDLSEGRHDRFIYYAFDLLHLDGRDLRPLPLTERKRLLELLLRQAAEGLRYSEHLTEDGGDMLRHACRLSLEGLVSKRADAPYRSGRGKDWVKSKCAFRQEFVIGGFTPSTAAKNAIGSLVLGVHEAGKLVCVGRVGTGFSQTVARDLHAQLSRRERARSPFAKALTAEERRGVTFVAPDLVAEVEFRGWTGDHHLRHAAFRGLREDKPAREIVREKPVEGESMAPEGSAARSKVKLTHPDRVYWPEEGITKQGLADYYAEVWRHILPFVVARPLALLRCPDGIASQCFFQKHSWRGMNKAIKVRKDKDGEELLTIGDLDGLIALVQSGALEIHPWGAPLADVERPDMLIFDLDPGEGVGWDGVVDGAREIRARLEAQGLAAFVKTSGGKGLHVVAPLKPKATWEKAKAFTKTLADSLAADDPDRFIAVATKARRKGRIFIDYLRNGRGATAVAAYCPRARAGAGVSMPVAWEELDQLAGAAQFTLADAPARLAHLAADPWDDFRAAAVPLPEAAGGRRRKT